MKKSRITAVLLSLCIILSSGLNCYAETTQEQINNKKAEQQQTQKSYQSAKQTLEDLQTKKDDKEAYLTQLQTKLEELKDNLEDLQNQYDTKQKELEELQTDLDAAEETRKQQYEDMKLRIQFMYEKNDATYIEMLFSAESFADFLNKAENISAISEYDRRMLEQYEETVELIAEKEQQVEKEKSDIAVLKEECEAEEEEVSLLVEETYNQIRQYESEIQDSQSAVSALLNQISEQQEELNALIKKQKDEQAAAELARKKAAEEAAKKKAAEEAAAQKSEKEESSSSSPGSSESKSENESKSKSTGSTSSAAASGTSSSSAPASSAESSSGSTSGSYLGRFKLTAYCPCAKCCGKSDGITASGTKATAGRTVAMGGLPLGTKIRINGVVYTVEDRGTVYGHVDIFKNSHSEALAFGVKYADVYLVD